MKEEARIVDASESQVLERRTDAPLVRNEPSIMEVIDRAMQTGRTVEELRELFALSERMGAAKAKSQWNAAFAGFKAECPPIERKTENPQFKVLRNGVMVARKFASLPDIEAVVGKVLAKHGLSYRWGDMKVEGSHLTMPCIVAHAGGHSESSTSMPVPVESKAGSSDQQKYGAAQTYAMRYSLISALGLTSCDEDSDGDSNPEKITDHEAANLSAALDAVGGDKAMFLQFLQGMAPGIVTMADLPKSRLAAAHAAIEQKRKARK